MLTVFDNSGFANDGNNENGQSPNVRKRICIYQKQSSQALMYTSTDQDRRLTPISDQFWFTGTDGTKSRTIVHPINAA